MPSLTPETRRYLRKEYPHNHIYRVGFGRLWPSLDLARRARKIEALYPPGLESLVDLSVSKGYFALHAGRRATRPRVLGIDVSAHLELDNVRSEILRLHELGERLDEFGGPFQTVLAINMYQFLYFGSTTEPEHYESHDEIFELLRSVCSDTVVFSNCVSFERLPPWLKRRAEDQGRADDYVEASIRRAAEGYFAVEDRGMLGSRPLWKLTTRPSA